MKSILILLTSLIIFPFIGVSQTIENINEISPFHEELAAIRKGDTWAFINTKGEVIIDYRNDLVWNIKSATKADKGTKSYPLFADGRCVIKKQVEGINYYGYIDKNGKTIIPVEYLNATSFDQGHAIVLKINKKELGKNDILDKKIVSYSYDEVVINPSGETKTYLRGPKPMVLSKSKLKQPPVILSYLLSSNIVAEKTDSDQWKLHVINSTH